MKTTFTALKVWLLLGVLVISAGCPSPRNDNNNGGFNGYPYGGFPGNGGPVPPGGLLASVAGLVNIPGDCGGNQSIDFELFLRAGAAGGQMGQMTSATVDGQIRMLQSDCMCGINIPGPSVMPVIPHQSQVQIQGSGSYQYMTGRLAVQGPFGMFNINIQQARILSKINGPAVGRISGMQFPYYLEGSVQPGNCQQPNQMTDWSFDPM